MNSSLLSEWELVVGLEIHVELNTRSKLFSGAPNHFGDEPNTNISVVCTGQPGALPVLNQEAVRKAVLLGCALEAEVATYSRFDRKSYFYPDSPRNFQITQYEFPIIKGGWVRTDVGGQLKCFAIDHAHLEDDAGMLKHFNTFAGVDYNRAGVPLIEIVSTPCLFSSEEAVAYAVALKAILEYLDISDCNMEEGSLRMDANVSVRKKGEKELRNKIEIKNMNSFSFMQMALESEFRRQVRAYLTHPDADPKTIVEPATYRWDPERKETVLMRRKETAEDYHYFPEPDLLPLLLEQEYIEQVRTQLPELPYVREQRYRTELGLNTEQSTTLVNEKALADYFDEIAVGVPPKAVANWLLVEFGGRYKEKGVKVWQSGIPATHIRALVQLIEKGTITGKIGKKVADEMVLSPNKHPELIVRENPDLQPVQDESAIRVIVEQVIADNPQSVQDYRQGRERAFAFLVGQVMKATGGKAPPALVNQLLKKLITF